MKHLVMIAATVALVLPGSAFAGDEQPLVYRARVESPWLTPATALFIENAIAAAERQHAACLVLIVNLSGGMADSTRAVLQAIDNSSVPIVVYVAPEGARATGAACYLAFAGDLLALAPGTDIGEAVPAHTGLPEFADNVGVSIAQWIPSTASWADFIENRRSRNGRQAMRLVQQDALLPAGEAVKSGVADLLADSFDDLLTKMDGRMINLATGRKRLSTKGAVVRDLNMTAAQRILGFTNEPNIPFSAAVAGMLVVLLRLSRPRFGWIGYLGLALLSAALILFALLPIQAGGTVLVVGGFAFFVVSVFVPRYGVFALLGMASLFVGGLAILEAPRGFLQVSPFVAGAGCVVCAVAAFFSGRSRPRQTHRHAAAFHEAVSI